MCNTYRLRTHRRNEYFGQGGHRNQEAMSRVEAKGAAPSEMHLKRLNVYAQHSKAHFRDNSTEGFSRRWPPQKTVSSGGQVDCTTTAAKRGASQWNVWKYCKSIAMTTTDIRNLALSGHPGVLMTRMKRANQPRRLIQNSTPRFPVSGNPAPTRKV